MRDRLRIAHFALGRTNPEAADGIDKTVYHLSRAQAGFGNEVRLFSITNKSLIPIPGVSVSLYPAIQPPRVLFTRRLQDLLAWRSPFNLPTRLWTDLLAWGPDILHLHGVHISQNVVLAGRARRAGIPYCVTVHGMLARPARQRRRWLKRVAAAVEKPFLDRAAFLHALSDDEVEDLRTFGTKASIVVAPNAIDLENLIPSPAVEGAQAALLAPGVLQVVFLGRLDPQQKGLDLLLEGFADAREPQARLMLIGPSWRDGRTQLEALAARLGVADRVVFTGAVHGQDKIDLLAGASVFVHPSRWEGLAFSLLEAAALGKPCLLTPAADPRGSFAREGAALVVEPNRTSIALALQQFAQMDAADRLAMGRRARALVEREFSWPPTARKLITAYHVHALERASK